MRIKKLLCKLRGHRWEPNYLQILMNDTTHKYRLVSICKLCQKENEPTVWIDFEPEYNDYGS